MTNSNTTPRIIATISAIKELDWEIQVEEFEESSFYIAALYDFNSEASESRKEPSREQLRFKEWVSSIFESENDPARLAEWERSCDEVNNNSNPRFDESSDFYEGALYNWGQSVRIKFESENNVELQDEALEYFEDNVQDFYSTNK